VCVGYSMWNGWLSQLCCFPAPDLHNHTQPIRSWIHAHVDEDPKVLATISRCSGGTSVLSR
jgi:hypothetical protein